VLHHALRVAQHIVVPEPQDFESLTFQVAVAGTISPRLLVNVMLPAIELDYQPR
jgi:hypothetical protein